MTAAISTAGQAEIVAATVFVSARATDFVDLVTLCETHTA